MLGGSAGSVLEPANRVKLQPQYSPNAIREQVIWGPFKLGPGGVPRPGFGHLDQNSDILGGAVKGLCQDCVVLNAVSDTVFKNGSIQGVNHGIYNVSIHRRSFKYPAEQHKHHIIVSDFGHKQLPNPVFPLCPGSTMEKMATMFGGSIQGMAKAFSDMQEKYMPAMAVFIGGGGSAGTGLPYMQKNSNVNSGWYITKSDTFNFMAELVNYDKVEKEVYLSIDHEYLPGGQRGYLDAGMGSIAIDGCNITGLGFYPPADKAIEYTSNDWLITDSGYLINITPHVHDGATNIKFFKNGELVCTIDAVYGADKGSTTVGGESWQTITSFNKDQCSKPIPISPGDKVKMTSGYDLTKHKL
jgi:hypothetical protein